MSAEYPDVSAADVRDVVDSMAVAARTPGVHVELSEISMDGCIRWMIENTRKGVTVPIDFVADSQFEKSEGASQ